MNRLQVPDQRQCPLMKCRAFLQRLLLTNLPKRQANRLWKEERNSGIALLLQAAYHQRCSKYRPKSPGAWPVRLG